MARPIRIALGTLGACWALVVSAVAAPPQIGKIAAPVLQLGAASTIVLDGTDLLPNPRIVLPVPIAAQVVKDKATASRVQIEVTLDKSVPPGVYHLRVANDKGISNAVGVEIDEAVPQPFGAQLAQLPAFRQGTLVGSATLSTSFTGKQGQRLVVDVEARRLGSAIDPVVKLLDARRVQLSWAMGSTTLAGDARLSAVLPAEGGYTVELHDSQYRAGTPNRFRVRIGDFSYADLAFPLAGQRGTRASFQVIGSVPENTRLEVDLGTEIGGSVIRLPRVPGVTGAPLRALVSDIPEVLESEPPQGADASRAPGVTVPAGINGRIRTPKEEDSHRLRVQPGQKLRFDILAERAGSALDGVLMLRNEAGMQLARSDDQPETLDPGLDFTVPNGVTTLVAVVSDLHGRGGPNFVYRLAVTPLGMPDFRLALLDDRLHVPRNGSALTRVRVSRAGYDGPIKLTVPGLPVGVALAGDEIPAGASEALLSLTAPEGTPLAQVVQKLIGASVAPPTPPLGRGGNGGVRRVALNAETPLSRTQPWLRTELALAVTEAAPITIAWDAGEASLKIGKPTSVKVLVNRAADAKGPIRLSLVTSQIVPKTKDGKMDDVTRALRLEGTPTIAANQAMADTKIVVPGDLPALPYDLAIRAELLSADGKSVQATAVTPARRLVAGK